MSANKIFIMLSVAVLLMHCGPQEEPYLGPPFPVVPIVEDPVRYAFDPLLNPVPIANDSVLILPMFRGGTFDGSRHEYVVTRPFVIRPGELVRVPSRVKTDGQFVMYVILVEGYWPLGPNNAFYHTRMIDGKECIVVPLAKSRSERETIHILKAFRKLLCKNEFSVGEPCYTIQLPGDWGESEYDRVATATELWSYRKKSDPKGDLRILWKLSPGQVVHLVFSAHDKAVINNYFDNALARAIHERD